MSARYVMERCECCGRPAQVFDESGAYCEACLDELYEYEVRWAVPERPETIAEYAAAKGERP